MSNLIYFIKNCKYRFLFIINLCFFVFYLFLFIKDIKYFSLNYIYNDFFEMLMRYFIFTMSSIITLLFIKIHKSIFYLSPIIFIFILKVFIIFMFYITVNYDIRYGGNYFILVTTVNYYHLIFIFTISFFIDLIFKKKTPPLPKTTSNST